VVAVEGDQVSVSPLVLQTAESLESLTRTPGTLDSGRLPAERNLADQLAISRATLRKALTMLERRGVLVSSPQSGWYVTEAPLSAPPQRLLSFTELATRRGQVVSTLLLSETVRAPTKRERDLLHAPSVARILELQRLRFARDQRASYDTAVIALWRAGDLSGVDWSSASLYAELRKRNAMPSQSDFEVASRLAGDDAEILNIDRNAPVAHVLDLCRDQFGGPMVLGSSVYPAENYRFRATLFSRA
jgi:GntR family transcriptional regulator